jgi:hypothetical protein
MQNALLGDRRPRVLTVKPAHLVAEKEDGIRKPGSQEPERKETKPSSSWFLGFLIVLSPVSQPWDFSWRFF